MTHAATLAAAILVAAACASSAPPGTLGVPTTRPSTPAPTAAPRTTAPATTGAPSASPSTTASASPSSSITPTTTPSGSPAPTGGSATPTPRPSERPAVAAASATQISLTIAFTHPMKTQNACGTQGSPTGAAGTIDALPVGASASYASTDRAFDETLRSATRATISADCTTVTFLYERVAPSGTFALTVSQVQDLDGLAIDPARATVSVTIRDEGPPYVLAAESTSDVITVSFSEPMLQTGEGGGVTLLGNYRLGGAALPATGITCNDAGCRSVRIAMQRGVLVVGRSYSLRVANTVDRAGRNISPDPTTLTFNAR